MAKSAQLWLNSRNGDLPEKALKLSLKELGRLRKMSSQMPEYSSLRNYLDLVVDLPWNKTTKETVDINKAKDVRNKNLNFLRILSFPKLRIWTPTTSAWTR